MYDMCNDVQLSNISLNPSNLHQLFIRQLREALLGNSCQKIRQVLANQVITKLNPALFGLVLQRSNETVIRIVQPDTTISVNQPMSLAFLPLSCIHIHCCVRLEHDMAYTLEANNSCDHKVHELE